MSGYFSRITHDDPYWHPSNILSHYGEADCPLAQGDFAHAMRVVQDAVTFEMMQWMGESSDDAVWRFKSYGLAAAEAGEVWQDTLHDTAKTLATLRRRVTKLLAQDNITVEDIDRADNLKLMMYALESNDYATLAI